MDPTPEIFLSPSYPPPPTQKGTGQRMDPTREFYFFWNKTKTHVGPSFVGISQCMGLGYMYALPRAAHVVLLLPLAAAAAVCRTNKTKNYTYN